MELLKSAIAYIRCSTAGQVGEYSYGEDLQEEAIRKYADENGYVVRGVYKDTGSGTQFNEQLEDLLFSTDIGSPKVDAVIVFKNDRIARDTTLFFTALFYIKRKGMELLSVMDNVESDDPMYNIRLALVQMIAEQERKNIKIRTSAGRNVKAMQGGYSGGKAPYGYEAIKGNLYVKEDEAKVVKLIFQYLNDGIGVCEIARRLNEAGYTNRSGNKFSSSSICSIRDNRRTYLGYYKYGNGSWVQGKHEKIISAMLKDDDMREEAAKIKRKWREEHNGEKG